MKPGTESETETSADRAGTPVANSHPTAHADGKSSPPLYVQIAGALKDEIVNGAYPVGSLLPTEGSLSEHFTVSRYTVREALRLLREDGLVSSRQGAGTVVIPPVSAGSDIQQFMSIDDLLAFGTDTRLAIESIGIVTIDEKLAARTDLTAGEDWLRVRGYRYPEGTDVPVCSTEFYINRAFAAVGRLLQRHKGPIFPLIEDLFGQNIVEVNQQISATLVSPELATALKVKAGSAALEVRRRYRTSDGRVAQLTFNTHPASRFKHSMSLRRVKT